MHATLIRVSIGLIAVLMFVASSAHGAPRAPAKVTISYSGSGSATFQEISSQAGDNSCPIETTTSTESVTGATWNVEWKNVRPADGANPDPKSATFSAANTRTDVFSCGGQLNCNSTLGYFEGIEPGLLVAKSGRNGFIITVIAEQTTRGSNASGSTCLQSSVFDNAITEGMNSTNITAVRIKLTPNTKSKRTTIPITIDDSFDCKDPAKDASPYISNSCSISTEFSGNVRVNGKWKARKVN
jgi:hypothetical protein